MDTSKSVGLAAVFVCLVSVCADPNCQLFEENDVVCNAGSDDYFLRKGLFSNISQATRITLRNCRIIDIEPGAFENDFILYYIDLSENKLSSLKSGVLDGHSKVTHLNLSHNLLTTFTSDFFVQKYNLETLDLKANRINSLPMDVFVPLKKLRTLNLSHNNFLGKNLDSYLFTKNRKIQRLDLSINDMSSSPDNLLNVMQELEFLNLARCSLKEVPYFVTRANMRLMKHLSLSTNQISQISNVRTFMNFKSLEKLNLAENLIENIVPNAFVHLTNIKEIILRNNRLTVLPEGVFRNLINLWFVDLSHNSIEYVSPNAFRGTTLQYLDLSNNRFTYFDTDFAAQLRNVGVRIKKLYFDENPWQCACLNEILTEVKYHDIEYNRDKYDGKHAVCVTTKKFTCQREQMDNRLYVEMYDYDIKGVMKYDSNNTYYYSSLS